MVPPLLLLVAVLLSVGCRTPLGSVPLLGANPDALGIKMLRPAAEARSCRASVFGVPLRAGEPDVGEAFAEILQLDPEGDVLSQVGLHQEHLVTGIYNRRCIVVRGDLGRLVPTITVPSPGGHHH